MKKLLATLALVTALSGSAFALTPDELLKDPALEARARAISAQLRCLVCQNQSIDDSDAPLAHDLRKLVREQLTAGKTDAEAMDFIVARYGEFVLLKPRFEASTMLLWATPFVVLLLAGGALLMRRRNPAPAPEKPLTEAERAALQKALE